MNNIQGKVVKNIRLSLRQGDLPSMHFFSYGIDPLLTYLDKRLKGILISSLPVLGPVSSDHLPLPPVEERYRVIGYADDVKPAITSITEFTIVDEAMALFENASGCRLHRDPATKKCKFLPLAKWRGSLKQVDIPCSYMTISDHLEMIGVELRATWAQSRKANGDIVQSRVENTIKSWKSGKFMPLNMRSWSVNQYCLSKVFFRTHSVDLRVLDITRITSLVKSWLYADQLLKPEERVMFRPSHYGGLGVLNVKYKAMAGMIRSFLETAGNVNFRSSLYHTLLCRYHVFEDRSFSNPGTPPFYSEEFFTQIRKVHQESPVNIFHMTEGDWYSLLLEQNCTMEVGEANRWDKMEFIRCRVENLSPGTDWEQSWKLARLQGLGPDNITFLFRLLHQTLPTQERVARTKPRTNSNCKIQGCLGELEENLSHALLYCSANDGIGLKLLQYLQETQPDLQADAALRLELPVEEDQELPVVWVTANVLRCIWNLRQSGTRVRPHLIRSKLEAEVNLLRETRFNINVPKIEEIASKIFS